MRYIFLFISLLCIGHTYAQPGEDTIMNRIVLVGDAGSLINGQAPVLAAVKKFIPLDKKTTIVYLGDNLYRNGLPDEQDKLYTSLRNVLDSQVALVKNTKATAYMIPGNHDWENGKPGGYGAVVRQQRYVDAIGTNVKYYPEDGCPGPVEVHIGNDIVLIIMDSQWWLHPNDKPGIESDCPFKTKGEVVAEIEDILLNNPKKLALFACHHPFRNNGVHGGYFGIKQHIFPLTDIRKNLYIPLPIIGSIYPISRSVFGSPQDMKYPSYVNMSDTIQAIVKHHPNAIYVAGHEHSLQYFDDSNSHYIISGSGCKTNRVEKTKRADFVRRANGFAVLEISKNKNVRLSFYTIPPDTFGMVYSKNILNFSTPSTLQDSIPATEPVYVYKDSALVAPSEQYKEASKLKLLMMGTNYRQEWSTPVKLKVFNINKEKGGFRIVSLGGGRQTKSLTLVDKKGIEWKLRTVDKDPDQIVPLNMRSSLSRDLSHEIISASHPYAAIMVPGLADAIGVPNTKPEFFFVPDDPAFGFYRGIFANKVCQLDRKNALIRETNTRSTPKMLNKMIEDNEHVVDQGTVLNARLLDMLIGDWDRHFDQWRWEVSDTGKGKVYYPIPRDRDQAFYYSDGLLLNSLARSRLPFLKGFRDDIPRINWLNYTARDFDRLFLNSLSKEDWEKAIISFREKINDSVIDNSVKKLPQPVYGFNGEIITAKLKSRRELMMKEGLSYYDFVSRFVNVLGSNKQEYFSVTGADSGKVMVQVYARDTKNDTSFLRYTRLFDPLQTQEIRLYGFNDNDVFYVDKDVKSRIRLRIIGGRGDDTFSVNGSMPNYLYDLNTEHNTILADKRTKNRMSGDTRVNGFDYNEFRYQDVQRFPWINVGLNSEDGPMAGLGFWRRTYGFRKAPFKTETRLRTLYSFLGNAYQIKYNGIHTAAFHNTDVMVNAEFVNPTLNNFFGLGNETQNFDNIDRSFYRVRYKYLMTDLLFRKNFFGKVKIAVGPTFYYYWNRYIDNRDRILGQPELVGLSIKDVYSRKTYLGGKANININNLNNDIFPTRGINWTNELTHMQGLNKSTTPITRFQSDMEVYASLSDPAKLVAVLRLGGGHIFSKSFEYFQALNLGGNNYLRGFRKNRFSGSSMFYNSIELRAKIADIHSYILPGTLGAIGFNDVGRVWMTGEKSGKWHHGYGGGFYFIPYNLIILSTTVGFSEEETLFNFTIGTKLNLTF